MAAGLKQMTDLELFEMWERGNKRAAGVLFDRHYEAVDRFFRNKACNGHDDLVQQTFAACIEGHSRFRRESSFRTYLFAIAHNTLRSHFRAKRREHTHLEFAEVSAHDLAPGPSTMYRARREHQLLLEALRHIPLDYQIVLELYYWEELSGSAIAEIVEIPENTVRSRGRKGRQLLEQKMRSIARNVDELEATLDKLDEWARSIHAVELPTTAQGGEGEPDTKEPASDT